MVLASPRLLWNHHHHHHHHPHPHLNINISPPSPAAPGPAPRYPQDAAFLGFSERRLALRFLSRIHAEALKGFKAADPKVTISLVRLSAQNFLDESISTALNSTLQSRWLSASAGASLVAIERPSETVLALLSALLSLGTFKLRLAAERAGSGDRVVDMLRAAAVSLHAVTAAGDAAPPALIRAMHIAVRRLQHAVQPSELVVPAEFFESLMRRVRRPLPFLVPRALAALSACVARVRSCAPAAHRCTPLR